MALSPWAKKIWADPVWSKVISVGIVATIGIVSTNLFRLLDTTVAETSPTIETPIPEAKPIPAVSSLTAEVLKNLTYTVEGMQITLRDGKREFVPDERSGKKSQEVPIYVYLVEWAFGKLSGNGKDGAIAILQVTDGGSGIYYYAVPVLNDTSGQYVAQKAYLLGDRLQFRSIVVQDNWVTLQLMMHSSDDPLCCPTEFRTLKFIVQAGALQCTTKPCSELSAQ